MKAPLLPLCALVAGCGGVSFPATANGRGRRRPRSTARRASPSPTTSRTRCRSSPPTAAARTSAPCPSATTPSSSRGRTIWPRRPTGNSSTTTFSNYVPGTGSGPHGAHGTGNVPGSLVKLDARTYEPLGEALVSKQPRRHHPVGRRQARLCLALRHRRRVQALSTPGATEDEADSPVAIIDTTTMTRLSLTQVCAEGARRGALRRRQDALRHLCAPRSARRRRRLRSRASDGDRAACRSARRRTSWPGPQPSYGPYALTVIARRRHGVDLGQQLGRCARLRSEDGGDGSERA